MSRLQAVPDEERGRLFGFSASVENAGFGLGMLVSGFLLESFSPFQVVASLHGLAIAGCLALLAYLVLRRPSTEPDARVRPPGGGVLRKERG